MPDRNTEGPGRRSIADESEARAPYFDSRRKAWVLSRGSDVEAAFLEPNLWLVGPDASEVPDAVARKQQAHVRMEALAAFPAGRLSQWADEWDSLAREIAKKLPRSRSVDVAAEYAFPWSLEVALRVTGAPRTAAGELCSLAEAVTAGTADPENAGLKEAAARAGVALDRELADSPPPMASATFVALSQTLPRLLANGWLLLLCQPEDLDRLRSDESLLPRAVEELLRVGGLARTLHRRALADVVVGGVRIQQGERVDLMVDVANQDPSHFPADERLALEPTGARAAKHFALGAGQHSCAAAALIRTAVTVATRTFVRLFEPAEDMPPAKWRGGSGFRWPAHVYARRR